MYPPKKTILNVDFALKLSLYIVELFYMSQMNPKEFFHNTTYSAELPYIHTYIQFPFKNDALKKI